MSISDHLTITVLCRHARLKPLTLISSIRKFIILYISSCSCTTSCLHSTVRYPSLPPSSQWGSVRHYKIICITPQSISLPLWHTDIIINPLSHIHIYTHVCMYACTFVCCINNLSYWHSLTQPLHYLHHAHSTSATWHRGRSRELQCMIEGQGSHTLYMYIQSMRVIPLANFKIVHSFNTYTSM